MSWTINELVTKIVLPIMVFTLILGGLNTIKVESINPLEEDVKTSLGQVGNQNIKLGAGEDAGEEEAEEQFRAAVAFNMLAASDCRIIMPVDQAVQNGWATTTLNGVQNNEAPSSYTSYFPGFEPLTDTGFSPTCVGTSNVASELKSAKKDIESTADASISLAVSGLTASISPFTGAKMGSSTIESYVSSMFTSEMLEDSGFDMEGRFGKTNFEVKKEFTVGPGVNNPGEDNRLLGFKINDVQGDVPPFWKAKRGAVFLPDGISPTENNIKLLNSEQLQAKSDSNEENLYRARVRMRNVPQIINNPDELEGKKDKKTLKTLFRNSEYIFCKGASGYLQSNSGSIDNSGESDSADPIKENSVYPLVEIEQKAEGCINTNEDHGLPNSNSVGLEVPEPVLASSGDDPDHELKKCGTIDYQAEKDSLPTDNIELGTVQGESEPRTVKSFCALKEGERNPFDNYKAESLEYFAPEYFIEECEYPEKARYEVLYNYYTDSPSSGKSQVSETEDGLRLRSSSSGDLSTDGPPVKAVYDLGIYDVNPEININYYKDSSWGDGGYYFKIVGEEGATATVKVLYPDFWEESSRNVGEVVLMRKGEVKKKEILENYNGEIEVLIEPGDGNLRLQRDTNPDPSETGDLESVSDLDLESFVRNPDRLIIKADKPDLKAGETEMLVRNVEIKSRGSKAC